MTASTMTTQTLHGDGGPGHDRGSRRRSGRGCAPRGSRPSPPGWPASCSLGLPWLRRSPLLLVPDVSAVGYLRGPRVGAIAYNLVHDLATGVAVAGLGLCDRQSCALALAGRDPHRPRGMDRMAGYGLKLPRCVPGHASRPDRARALSVGHRPQS